MKIFDACQTQRCSIFTPLRVFPFKNKGMTIEHSVCSWGHGTFILRELVVGPGAFDSVPFKDLQYTNTCLTYLHNLSLTSRLHLLKEILIPFSSGILQNITDYTCKLV